MSENWKPGDVAVVTTTDGQEVRAVRASDGMRWVLEPTLFPPRRVADARRLVVIDPEDREQVDLLLDLIDAPVDHPMPLTRAERINNMQAALREFANPVVKPEEPTGLGAVVEDASGVRWVLAPVDGNSVQTEWVCSHSTCRTWGAIEAVRVLSEGVTND